MTADHHGRDDDGQHESDNAAASAGSESPEEGAEAEEAAEDARIDR